MHVTTHTLSWYPLSCDLLLLFSALFCCSFRLLHHFVDQLFMIHFRGMTILMPLGCCFSSQIFVSIFYFLSIPDMELSTNRKGTQAQERVSVEDHMQLLSESQSSSSCNSSYGSKCLHSIHMFTEGGTVFDGFLLAGNTCSSILCITPSF